MGEKRHSYRELADLVMKYGPQCCIRVHREQALERNELQIIFEQEERILNEMASLAYRYARKRLKEQKKK